MSGATWELTVNNYDEADIQLLKSWIDEVSRMMISKEVGESGTPHLQGRITFKRAYRLAGLKKLAPRFHWELTKCKQDNLYLMKDGSEILIDINNRKQGHRTDLEGAIQVAKESGMKRAADEFPAAVAKFHRGIEAVLKYTEERPGDKDFVPREWQQRVLDMFPVLADDRKILWVYDAVGNNGKSRLARYLLCEHNAIILSGKVADMAYAYNKEPIVIFDVPRTEAENMTHLYAFAEKLKNGQFFTGKFESCMKIFHPPIVMFMTNFEAPLDVWSVDRLITITI